MAKCLSVGQWNRRTSFRNKYFVKTFGCKIEEEEEEEEEEEYLFCCCFVKFELFELKKRIKNYSEKSLHISH